MGGTFAAAASIVTTPRSDRRVFPAGKNNDPFFLPAASIRDHVAAGPNHLRLREARMSLFLIVIIALVAAALVGTIVVLGRNVSTLAKALETSARNVESLHDERRALLENVEAPAPADRNVVAPTETRVETIRKTYRILTLGVAGTGKTSLVLKWANPLADLSTLGKTKVARYERTVSRVRTDENDTEHVFEVHDCDGERLVDAVQALSTEEVHGLLFVVDLGGKDAKHIDHDRVAAQLQEFQPQALRYFFVPKMLGSCKTVVLFINKSDLTPGAPAQIEDQAKQMYQPLIDGLTKCAGQVEVKVFVGSANYGHSTPALFSHFLGRILPKDAYDDQLRQGIQAAEPSAATQAPLKFSAPPLPPMEAITNAPSMAAKPSARQHTLTGPMPFLQKSKDGAKSPH